MKAQTLNKQDYRKNMMLVDSVPKIIIKMSIPTIIAFIISSVYSLADTYFVSALGTDATAAVSVNSSLDQFIMMAGSLFAIGGNSYIARLLGAKDEQKASRVLSTAFWLAAAAGLLITILGVVFMTPMIRLLGAEPSSEQYAIDYATYVLLVAPLMSTSFVMNQCLRAEGSAILSMVGMGFGGILNIFLDWLFVAKWGMGVAGASIATAISKVVSFAILLYPYLFKRSLLRIRLKFVELSKDIIGQIVSVGSSSMFRSGLAVVSAIVLNNIAGDISVSVQAGIGVTTRVMMFPFSIILGFGTGFQPVVGFNWGAGRYDRVRESFRFASWVSVLGAAVMGAVLALGANFVIGIFEGEVADPMMMRIGALAIILQSVSLPIHAWVAIVNMFCSGLGRAKGAMLLATARQGTCFLPFIHLLSHLFGADGVASIQALADVLSLALAIPLIIKVMRDIKTTENQAAASNA